HRHADDIAAHLAGDAGGALKFVGRVERSATHHRCSRSGSRLRSSQSISRRPIQCTVTEIQTEATWITLRQIARSMSCGATLSHFLLEFHQFVKRRRYGQSWCRQLLLVEQHRFEIVEQIERLRPALCPQLAQRQESVRL